jgi:hypothetical protein
MPRKSPEALSAALIRAGTPPPPPLNLSKPAADLWRSIVSSFAADRFDSGSLPLLERYCRMVPYAAKLQDEVDKCTIGSAEHGKMHRLLISANSSIGSLASLLRLSVQAQIDRRSGKITERYPHQLRPWNDKGLLGGSAIVRRPWEDPQ